MSTTKVTRISPGEIADRLVASLAGKLTSAEYIELEQSHHMFGHTPDFIDWYHISYEVLTTVFSYPSISAPYVLFGTHENYIQNYTDRDEKVIAWLDMLDVEELAGLKKAVCEICPGISWALDMTQTDPSQRFLRYLSSRCRSGFNRETPGLYVKQNFPQREECIEMLIKFNAAGKEARIPTDKFPMLAQAIGVSIHWLLGLKCPLFCRTAEAEELFDLFTLMPQEKKALFYMILSETGKKKRQKEGLA